MFCDHSLTFALAKKADIAYVLENVIFCEGVIARQNYLPLHVVQERIAGKYALAYIHDAVRMNFISTKVVQIFFVLLSGAQ